MLTAIQRQFMSEYQRDSDTFVQLVTYVYNTKVNHSTATNSFNLVLLRDPPGADAFDQPSELQTDDTCVTATSYHRSRNSIAFPKHRKKSDKNQVITRRGYNDNQDPSVCVVTSFKPGLWFKVDCLSLAFTATDRIVVD